MCRKILILIFGLTYAFSNTPILQDTLTISKDEVYVDTIDTSLKVINSGEIYSDYNNFQSDFTNQFDGIFYGDFSIFNKVENYGVILGDNNDFVGDFINNKNAEFLGGLSTFSKVYNSGYIDGDNNIFYDKFTNTQDGIVMGVSHEFDEIENDGVFEGDDHTINNIVNNNEFNNINSTISGSFYNTYNGVFQGFVNNVNNFTNDGLVYGALNTFNNFTNNSTGWIWVDVSEFNGTFVNEDEAYIFGNALSFTGDLINRSYVDVDENTEFNNVQNYAYIGARKTNFNGVLDNYDTIETNNSNFNGLVNNHNTILGSDFKFNNKLVNHTNANIQGEKIEFFDTENNAMILADFSTFNGKLNNNTDGWIIGSNIDFKQEVINNGDIVGNQLKFSNNLENYLNIDSLDSEFNNIQNYGTFSAYTSKFNGKVEQFNNAFLYANTSEFSADLDGGDYEIAYSNVINNSINARNLLANNTLLNSKNMNYESLKVISSSVYGGFRTKRLYASNSEFVLYFNDGYSGAIVVDEEIIGKNNSIKIINYVPDENFYPVLLAKGNKDISKDFSLYATRGFSLFGFKGELNTIANNGAVLFGIGNINALKIDDINELFKSENNDLFINKSVDKIEARRSELERVGVDTKIFENIKDNIYKNELLNNAILKLDFKSFYKDYFGYELEHSSANDNEYLITMLKANKFNEYVNFNNNIGLSLYKLSSNDFNHRINGGSVYANFDFNNFLINTDFRYNEHRAKIALNDLGELESKYFHTDIKLELGYRFGDIFYYEPRLGLIYEYLPVRVFDNENLTINMQRQNNLYNRLGFDIGYDNSYLNIAMSANYYSLINNKKDVILYDGFSNEKIRLKNDNFFDFKFQSRFLLNNHINVSLDFSKIFLHKDLNSHSFKFSIGYSF